MADEYPVPSIWQAWVLIRRLRKLPLKRILLAAISVGLIVATFVYFLPTIANYHDVWRVVQQLSWPWIGALLAATAINIVTFAPPWQVVLQGLTFMQAMVVTQASTALSSVIPGGIAAGVAGNTPSSTPGKTGTALILEPGMNCRAQFHHEGSLSICSKGSYGLIAAP